MTEIKKLLSDKDDYEIMKILRIPNSTYYRYKSQIYQQDRELYDLIAKESLESRALKIMKSLELCIKVNTEIATDKELDPKARIEASIKVVDANIMAYNLLENGPCSWQSVTTQYYKHFLQQLRYHLIEPTNIRWSQI